MQKLSFVTVIKRLRAESESKRVLLEFMDDFYHFQKLVESMRVFYYQIIYIQRHVKNRISTQDSKIEVLMNYWEKVIINLQLKASEMKDPKGNKLCAKIMLISKEV